MKVFVPFSEELLELGCLDGADLVPYRDVVPCARVKVADAAGGTARAFARQAAPEPITLAPGFLARARGPDFREGESRP